MTKSETVSRRIDVLAIGLFGLAVGALTVGMAQIGQIPEVDRVGVLVIALVFGGLVQVLAGIADIRYNEQLGGTALTMYGFFWPFGNGKVVWRNLSSYEPVSRA
jgi:succinate-acetate transporter protein